MAVVKNKTTDENRQFWAHVETVAKQVSSWPNWKGKPGGDELKPDSPEHAEPDEPQERFGT